MRRTGRRTQAGLTPGKDDNDVWHKADRKDTEWFYLRIVSVKNKCTYSAACHFEGACDREIRFPAKEDGFLTSFEMTGGTEQIQISMKKTSGANAGQVRFRAGVIL